MFGWIKKTISAFRPKNDGTTGIRNPKQWLIDWVRGWSPSDSGIKINWETSLSYPPVWYAVNKLCGHLAQMPIHKMRRLERGAEVAFRERGDYLLNVQPNAYQTPAVFKEQLMLHSLINGNGRAVMINDGQRVEELLPIHPDCTETKMVMGEKWHITNVQADDRLALFGHLDYIKVSGNRYAIPDRYVIHIPGLSNDGLVGLCLMKLAKNSWGLGLASEKASNKDFANGSKPGGVLNVPPGQLTDDEEAKQLKDEWNKFHSGVENAGRWGLLRDGITVQEIGKGGDHDKWVDQRKFQRQEAALWFLLESILGDDSSVSYNSLEQKNLAYLVNSLMRWIVKWEQECNIKLCNQRQRERRTHFFKFNVDSLLRADAKTRMQTLSLGIKNRIYSPNEARERLDMNPYEGGDAYENPSITPGAASESDSDIESDDSTNSGRDAIVSRLHHLIGVEAKRVSDAAKRAGNYLDWLDKFYESWVNTLGAAISQCGGDTEIAVRHCDSSHEQILELSGEVTDNEQWPAAVAGLVANWQDRAGEIADQIIEQELVG